MDSNDTTDRAVGCLIGSAYGDSLGASVEFDSLSAIRGRYGALGVTELQPWYGHPAGVVTDDTQMAIATAHGIVDSPDPHDPEATTTSIWRNYLTWLATQDDPQQIRAPGNTCLSALRSGRMGTLAVPLNSSAGCGAIMRAHPIGIAYADRRRADELGVASGVVTHGHPAGYVPAGFLAALISELVAGADLESTVGQLADELAAVELGADAAEAGYETHLAVHRALAAPRNGDPGTVIDDVIGGTGGWLGHDALAIGLYAVLCAPDDPVDAVRIAVNHSGDSDSTGCIAGAITGAMFGPEPFDSALAVQQVTLEHDGLLRDLGGRLATIRDGGSDPMLR